MSIHDALSAQQFNQNFLEKIATVEGQAELSEAGRQYVKVELQEAAFSRAVIPQEPITTSDCQRNVKDNSLYVIRDVEPGVSALGVDNLGEPDGNYVKGERYVIPIVNFVTKRFQITVEDLRAYQYKITKRIEDKSVPILEKLEDKFFLRLVGAAINTGKKWVIGTGPHINTADHIALKQMLQSGQNGANTRKLEVANMLMTQETYDWVIDLPKAGDDFGKDRVLNGITSDTIFGTKAIRTIKSDILPNGHIFAFTSPDFLGHNFAMGEPTFEIKSNFGLIEWQTKESIGMGIGNVEAAAMLTLTGSKSPVDGSALVFDTAPDVTPGTGTDAVFNYYASLRV